ncbi:bifunctional phosphopantothenoylcysteine decarboxylase/phosphopantothenate--cysteine ligase CoaBC [Weissella muntiaci]|uniref:Coenzyme A biosynthesis bifunctional protein CoaBC n=1 Tax=Weissella muntiaci TaxID=2508881 RepID=A0A6C2C7P6_9LACO|nr:bifunctional phosphopantothenoylcysteine decarboxylase/phosphopantothenate--cysteine ligase CoaBC [Weissella muntiaci]TYC50050.1 bifunctional phosphopantothenoylcysteine decarboxylase/phosphopantothenate--cysteine ligase CoaBC [Weissella muntiaci]
MFNNKKIVLIVSGGIAAYKAAVFARLLMKSGSQVRVVLTNSAREFVTEKTFAGLTHEEVLTDLFANNSEVIPHIALADWADYIFVVPATANIIAKIAQGLADDAASTVIVARHTPLIIAPAMNVNMFENPAVQRNLATLKADGVIIVEPTEGALAEGYVGKGRMPEPEEILARAEIALYQQDGRLKGKRVMISAGGTVEEIDPVRYISNRSSGKMGYAFAQAAAEAGAQVTLITTSLRSVPAGVNVIQVASAREMQTALTERFEVTDIVVMAAAVSDYRLAEPASQKMKKQPNQEHLVLDLVENPDILADLGAQKTHQYLIGFAAETEDLIEHAHEKLIKKNVDLLLANDVSKPNVGFGHDTNQVTVLSPNAEPIVLPLQDKLALAREILNQVADQIAEEDK